VYHRDASQKVLAYSKTERTVIPYAARVASPAENLAHALPRAGFRNLNDLSHFDELAFWFFTCSSLTTCFTFGTEDAILSACARWD
jgi:hypothetical protein